MHRLLPIVILIVIVAAFFSYTPFRREVAYKFGFSGDTTQSCCSEAEILTSSGEFDETASVAIFNNDVVDYPKTSLAYSNMASRIVTEEDSAVLGTKNAAGEDKWIEVSIEEQKLRAWEGNKIVMEFPISSGKWSPTPKGDFAIWYKTRNQSMKGGSKELGTYYNVPNVPNNQFFHQGYAVHGAYWHNNFGQPMSHGCVNAPLDQAAKLFEWTGPVLQADKNYARASEENPGTRVFVH